MPKFEVVSPDQHQHIRINQQRSAELGDNLMYCQTFMGEFRDVQAHYPILFQTIDKGDPMAPVALFGFERGENLFLTRDQWRARYIPLMVRRQPFSIGIQHQDNSNNPRRVINIDATNPRVNDREGVRIFDDLGEPTDYLNRVSGMLDTIHHWHINTQEFVTCLHELDLLEPVNIDVTVANGERGQLIGFSGIHEENFRALDEQALVHLWQKQYLDAIYMVLASMSNFGALIERKSQVPRY